MNSYAFSVYELKVEGTKHIIAVRLERNMKLACLPKVSADTFLGLDNWICSQPSIDNVCSACGRF